MPTYDYQCRRCGNITEVIHPMLEEGPSTCERCGGELRRILHPAGIIFKGSGFYKTDSRSSPSAGGSTRTNAPAADAAKPASGADGGSADGSSGTGSSPAASTGGAGPAD